MSRRRPTWKHLTREELAAWVEREGLCAQGAANRLGVARTALGSWLRGATVPHEKRQRALREIVRPAAQPAPIATDQLDGLSAGAARIVRAYLTLARADLCGADALLEIAERLARGARS